MPEPDRHRRIPVPHASTSRTHLYSPPENKNSPVSSEAQTDDRLLPPPTTNVPRSPNRPTTLRPTPTESAAPRNTDSAPRSFSRERANPRRHNRVAKPSAPDTPYYAERSPSLFELCRLENNNPPAQARSKTTPRFQRRQALSLRKFAKCNTSGLRQFFLPAGTSRHYTDHSDSQNALFIRFNFS